MPKKKSRKTAKTAVVEQEPDLLNRLHTDYYTTEEVAKAVGRNPEQWCRIRHNYITRFKLHVIKVGRNLFYEKHSANRMIEELLKNGD
jgi:hypothetical protein